ncbi:MAG: GNAT family N-acetyltransferase [Bacteroidetes bacterium]|nr:GNAT family N-acetyltransferase [Bacteroidota bacterium]
MIDTTTVSTKDELQQILDLQKRNLKQHISEAEKEEQGFVTMSFSMPMMETLHAVAPSIIIKDDHNVIAYAIVLLQQGRKAYPALEPMFVNLEKLNWQGKPLYHYNFYIMGQVCVDKGYRGLGLFDMLYLKHKEIYQHQYDFIVTTISTSNLRSLNAHKRVGFVTINTFTDNLDEWDVVLWDWS